MFNQEMLTFVAQILLIAGALNWGAIATYNMDFVNQLTGANIGNYVKMAVGAAGIYAAYVVFMSFYGTFTAAPAAPAPEEKQ